MSDGGHHPAALHPTIHHSLTGTRADYISSAAITNSRLAVAVKVTIPRRRLVILDWKTSQVLFVGQFLIISPPELESSHRRPNTHVASP